ncbi:nickel pincer cofactor biosynthesis protein LarC [bacterium]|nr:nickel pincer cofactor biosynthesis protein LarC [bacterium]
MKAYFDCSSGISGDMILGALLDSGVPLAVLEKELSRLKLEGYELSVSEVSRAGMRALKADVLISEAGDASHKARRWKDVKELIEASTLPPHIKKSGLDIFRRLFKAEAIVHGGEYTTVHLHELGAVDCMVDIFGTLIGLDILGIKEVYASGINLGSGTVKTAHGLLPVPAPATVELLRGVPVYISDVPRELTTPTGAVLISSIASGFGAMPEMILKKVGVGAGGAELKDRPNILRIFTGELDKHYTGPSDDVVVVETNIDDMNPQIYQYVMDRLFDAGALDVFITQGIMKKGRPGIMITVLCQEGDKPEVIRTLMTETTSIGVRFYKADRQILKRTIKPQKTCYGTIRFKEVELPDGSIRSSAEYDDCREVAERLGIPLRSVISTIEKT